MSRKVIEFDKTKRILAFVATCVETTSRSLCLSKFGTIQYLKEKSLIIEGQTNIQDNPIIQEIILSNRIGSISDEIAKRLDIEPLKALELFYASKTCEDLHNKETGLYLYSDLYIVDEFLFEQNREQLWAEK